MFRGSCPTLPAFESRRKIYQCYINVISVLTFIFINEVEHVTHPVVREPIYFPLPLLACRSWVALDNYSKYRRRAEHAVQTTAFAQSLTSTAESFLLVPTFTKTTLQYTDYELSKTILLCMNMHQRLGLLPTQRLLVHKIISFFFFFLVRGSYYRNRDKNCSCIISNLSQLSSAVKCCRSF